MKILLRAHEWAADHFSFIQYPNIKPANARTAQHTGLHWKHKMPWETRALIALLSIVAVISLLCGLLFMVFIAYSVLVA